MSRSKVSALAIVVALAAPGVARAQEEGVFVDPDSSSAKEYAIPLEESRRKGSSGKNDTPVKQGSRTAPAFGEGVSKDEDDGAAGPAAGGGGSSEGGGGDGNGSQPSGGSGGGSGASASTGADGQAAVERAEAVLRRDQKLASSDDLDGTTVTILAGGGVLLVAAFAGIALRRLRGNA